MNSHQTGLGKRKWNRNESKGSQRKFLLPSVETINLDIALRPWQCTTHRWHNRYVSWCPVKRPPDAPVAQVKVCFLMMAQPLRNLEIFWALCNWVLKRHWRTNFFGEGNSFISLNVLFIESSLDMRKKAFHRNQEKRSKHPNEHRLWS